MIDSNTLQQNILSSMYSWQSALEFEQRQLSSKWASFSDMNSNLSAYSQDFVLQQKNDLANFYIKKAHIARLFDISLSKYAEQTPLNSNPVSSILGISQLNIYSDILFWSKLLQITCSKNTDEASIYIMQKICQYYKPDDDIFDVMLADIKSVLCGQGVIIADLDLLIACQKCICPLIQQNDFAISKCEDGLYVSQKLELISPIYNHLHSTNTVVSDLHLNALDDQKVASNNSLNYTLKL